MFFFFLSYGISLVTLHSLRSVLMTPLGTGRFVLYPSLALAWLAWYLLCATHSYNFNARKLIVLVPFSIES